MDRLLTVNAGSSSVRLALFAMQNDAPAQQLAHWHGSDVCASAQEIRNFLRDQGAVQAVMHRVVHGGPHLLQPVRLTGSVRDEIERWSPLAPLHNPAAMRWVDACREALGPEVPHFATFDTVLFAQLPDVARTYALPAEVCEAHAVRRFGFHGLAHQAMWEAFCAARPQLKQGGRLVTLQLGSGCSAAAWRDGAPMDTTMGYSPLEGLMMSSRCGDVDAGLVLHLLRSGSSLSQIETMLSQASGVLGVSGESRDLRAAVASTAPKSQLAVRMFCYRVTKAVGAYAAVLQGLDGIVLGGGVGENMPGIRAAVLAPLQFLGVRVDEARNAERVHQPQRIDAGAGVDAWVVPVDEAQVMVKHMAQLRRQGSVIHAME